MDRLGLLIAFEGLDQSGKQTQAERLRDRLDAQGRHARLVSFPDYQTPIGREIGAALRGERTFGPDVMQLLYVANRHEWREELMRERAAGTVVVCDRYIASSVAYGEAHGLDPGWLRDIQRFLPKPDLTVFLDITPDTSARRKTQNRDAFERDLLLLSRVRNSYVRQVSSGWVRIDAERSKDSVAGDVQAAVDALSVD